MAIDRIPAARAASKGNAYEIGSNFSMLQPIGKHAQGKSLGARHRLIA